MEGGKEMKNKTTSRGLTYAVQDTPRLRIIDFFLTIRELDNSLLAVTEVTKLSKATVYNEVNKFVEQGLIKKTRMIGNTQLYQWNNENNRAKRLQRLFDVCIMM